jgi:hypothetical protein
MGALAVDVKVDVARTATVVVVLAEEVVGTAAADVVLAEEVGTAEEVGRTDEVATAEEVGTAAPVWEMVAQMASPAEMAAVVIRVISAGSLRQCDSGGCGGKKTASTYPRPEQD